MAAAGRSRCATAGLLDAAAVAVALSLEAFKRSTAPWDARLHELRGHPGPGDVAARLRSLLAGSSAVASLGDADASRTRTRCAACRRSTGRSPDALAYASGVLERELGAVTDNPLVFPAEGQIVSGGNFHGQPVALALDLARSRCELAWFSERRISPGSPPATPACRRSSRAPRPATRLMVAQYAAAALVTDYQLHAHPACVGSIPTAPGRRTSRRWAPTRR